MEEPFQTINGWKCQRTNIESGGMAHGSKKPAHCLRELAREAGDSDLAPSTHINDNICL